MKLFELTSGFIAAVLIALGAYQYVNRATVEEEPVVTDETAISNNLDPMWYQFNPGSGDYEDEVLDAENYTPYPGNAPTCLDGDIVCAVKLSPGIGNHPDQTQLSNLEGEIFPTPQPDADLILFLE